MNNKLSEEHFEIRFGGATQAPKIISSTTLRHENVLHEVNTLC